MPGRLAIFLSLCLATSLAACGPGQRSIIDRDAGPPPGLPNVTPGLFVAPLLGTAEDWQINTLVAEELRRYDIAASTESANAGSYVLYSLAEAAPRRDSGMDVTIHWDLLDPDGGLVGSASQRERLDRAEWDGLPADLQQLARNAAARIVNIVPGGEWTFRDPTAELAAREARRKLEERRSLYRRIAQRGGMGPLSQRLFTHAERLERQRDSVGIGLQTANRTDDSADDLAPLGAPTVPWIQLGTFRSEGAASGYWAGLAESHPELVGDLSQVTSPQPGDDDYVRLLGGPFPQIDAADRACQRFRVAGVSCSVALEPESLTFLAAPRREPLGALLDDSPRPGDSGLLSSFGLIDSGAAARP